MEHEGFIYDNLGTKKGITCARRGGNFCTGTVKKLIDGTIVPIKLHNGHQIQNPNETLVKAFREILKRRASTENLVLKHIYDEEARRNPEASGLYPYSTAECIMRLARKKSLPSLPSSLAELASLFDEGHLRRYSCCDEIMFKGCVHDVDGQATMIFACTTLLQLILSSNIEEIHVDATFKMVPSNMGNQLLTIHSMIDNYSIPIVYCLMESKTRNSYNCVFNFLKTHLLPNFNPSIIITDYESALRDTLISIFPTARTTGCWFHHNQVSSLV
ncbi:MULE domain-containing protein, partial [Aphis craccivora]